MGVYKFPCAIIQAIHSSMARFCWGSKDGQRSMHWKSWETLCSPKCFGGLGFRDLSAFNDALLGRNAWCLITQGSFLFGRVMKEKYYPKTSFLEASARHLSSFSWRSILGVKDLVRKGVLWRWVMVLTSECGMIHRFAMRATVLYLVRGPGN